MKLAILDFFSSVSGYRYDFESNNTDFTGFTTFLSQTWSLFAVGLAAALMGAASAVGLTVSVIRAIIHGGRSLLTHCRFPDAIGYSSITNECPFDPTRIYVSTQAATRRCGGVLLSHAGPTFIFTFLPDLTWNQLDNVVYEEKPAPWGAWSC